MGARPRRVVSCLGDDSEELRRGGAHSSDVLRDLRL